MLFRSLRQLGPQLTLHLGPPGRARGRPAFRQCVLVCEFECLCACVCVCASVSVCLCVCVCEAYRSTNLVFCLFSSSERSTTAEGLTLSLRDDRVWLRGSQPASQPSLSSWRPKTRENTSRGTYHNVDKKLWAQSMLGDDYLQPVVEVLVGLEGELRAAVILQDLLGLHRAQDCSLQAALQTGPETLHLVQLQPHICVLDRIITFQFNHIKIPSHFSSPFYKECHRECHVRT